MNSSIVCLYLLTSLMLIGTPIFTWLTYEPNNWLRGNTRPYTMRRVFPLSEFSSFQARWDHRIRTSDLKPVLPSTFPDNFGSPCSLLLKRKGSYLLFLFLHPKTSPLTSSFHNRLHRFKQQGVYCFRLFPQITFGSVILSLCLQLHSHWQEQTVVVITIRKRKLWVIGYNFFPTLGVWFVVCFFNLVWWGL